MLWYFFCHKQSWRWFYTTIHFNITYVLDTLLLITLCIFLHQQKYFLTKNNQSLCLQTSQAWMNQSFWTNRMRKVILSFWKSWLSVRISDSLIKMATCHHLIWQCPYQSNLTLTILTKLTSKQFWCIPDDLTQCFLFVESYKSILLISVPVFVATFQWSSVWVSFIFTLSFYI